MTIHAVHDDCRKESFRLTEVNLSVEMDSESDSFFSASGLKFFDTDCDTGLDSTVRRALIPYLGDFGN